MKIFALTFIALSTSLAFAEERTLCYTLASWFETDHVGQGWNLKDVVTNENAPFSQVVCDHPSYGNYLHDNPSHLYFKFQSTRTCLDIVKDMNRNKRSAFYFTVNTDHQSVVRVKREGENCPRETGANH